MVLQDPGPHNLRSLLQAGRVSHFAFRKSARPSPLLHSSPFSSPFSSLPASLGHPCIVLHGRFCSDQLHGAMELARIASDLEELQSKLDLLAEAQPRFCFDSRSVTLEGLVKLAQPQAAPSGPQAKQVVSRSRKAEEAFQVPMWTVCTGVSRNAESALCKKVLSRPLPCDPGSRGGGGVRGLGELWQRGGGGRGAVHVHVLAQWGKDETAV